MRIKQEFRDPKPPLELFYPPKWQINERVAGVQQLAAGESTERQLGLVDGDLDIERVPATAPRVDGLPLDLFDASTALG